VGQVVLVEKMRTGLGEPVMEAIERVVLLATANDITRAAVDHGHVSGRRGAKGAAGEARGGLVGPRAWGNDSGGLAVTEVCRDAVLPLPHDPAAAPCAAACAFVAGFMAGSADARAALSERAPATASMGSAAIQIKEREA
jgi:hypothetical protein